MRLIIATLTFIFLSFNVHAATFYIDHDAGADTNSSAQAQSQSTPWAHAPGMNGCASNCASYSVQSGDVFVLKGGVTWNGFADNASCWTLPASNITLQGGQRLGSPWGTGYPVIDGEMLSTTTRYGIRGTSKSGITIDGIRVSNTGRTSGEGGGILNLYGSTWEIKNSYIDSWGVNGIQVSSGSGTSINDVNIHDNVLANNGRYYFDTGTADQITNLKFQNNDIQGPGRTYTYGSYHTDGVFLNGNNKTVYSFPTPIISGNQFRGDWYLGATAMIYLSGCTLSGTECVLGSQGKYSTSGALIYNNAFVYENSGWSASGFSPAVAISVANGFHENVKVYNNSVLSAISGQPRAFAFDATVSYISGLDVQNNIISGVFSAVSMLLGSHISGTITIDNNHFYATSGHLLKDETSGGSTYDTCATIQARGYGTTYCANSDPKYTTLPSGGTTGSANLALQATSPAIGVGANLSATFTTDLEGTTRSVPWDMGAFCYAADASDTTAPSCTMTMTYTTGYSASTTLTCTDAVGVTAYCVSTTNDSSGCTWSASNEGTLTWTGPWQHTGYGFGRDDAGNIGSTSATVSIPGRAPWTKPINLIATETNKPITTESGNALSVE